MAHLSKFIERTSNMNILICLNTRFHYLLTCLHSPHCTWCLDEWSIFLRIICRTHKCQWRDANIHKTGTDYLVPQMWSHCNCEQIPCDFFSHFSRIFTPHVNDREYETQRIIFCPQISIVVLKLSALVFFKFQKYSCKIRTKIKTTTAPTHHSWDTKDVCTARTPISLWALDQKSGHKKNHTHKHTHITAPSRLLLRDRGGFSLFFSCCCCVIIIISIYL